MTHLFGSLMQPRDGAPELQVQGNVARCAQRQLVAAFEGVPAWKDEDLSSLARQDGHAKALIEGYHRHGEQVLDRLRGGCALIIHDGAANRALLATDRAGIVPLFYAGTANGLVFGSRADQVATHPIIDSGLNPQAIYNYLYFHVVPGPETVYDGVHRLQPGECLRWEAGRSRVEPYWIMEYREKGLPGKSSEWRQRFIDLVREAVRSRSSDNVRVGAFLSGGTDSSTVSGMLGQIHGVPADTYSIGFDAPGYDEMEYARLASRHFGTRHHEYYVTADDVVSSVPMIAAHFDQPFGNASAVPAYYCARMAREDGIERMLAGDGGDELFGGNTRYAKQKIFSLYGEIPLFMRRYGIEPLVFDTPFGNLGPMRKLGSYVRQARLPMPERMETYNLLDRLGPERIFTDDYLGRIDQGMPMSLLRETYHGAHAGHMLNRMLAVDMRFTLADSDLPKVSGACGLADIEVAFPFLDEDLMDFAAALPPRQKVMGTRLRYLFKEALRGFLPEEILTKRKQGFGLPFGLWLADHKGLRELTGDSLSSLKQRGIVRAAFIDELLDRHVTEHAPYYGTMVWVMLMLEQWLTTHENR